MVSSAKKGVTPRGRASKGASPLSVKETQTKKGSSHMKMAPSADNRRRESLPRSSKKSQMAGDAVKKKAVRKMSFGGASKSEGELVESKKLKPATDSLPQSRGQSGATTPAKRKAEGLIKETAKTSPSPATKKKNMNPGLRVIGGRIYDSENGSSCHQCRQKTLEAKASCKVQTCTINFCPKCLLNRYGEVVEEVEKDLNWKCPKCRDKCNCSQCRKKSGLGATGILTHAAKATGHKSVADLLHVLPEAQQKLAEISPNRTLSRSPIIAAVQSLCSRPLAKARSLLKEAPVKGCSEKSDKQEVAGKAEVQAPSQKSTVAAAAAAKAPAKVKAKDPQKPSAAAMKTTEKAKTPKAKSPAAVAKTPEKPTNTKAAEPQKLAATGKTPDKAGNLKAKDQRKSTSKAVKTPDKSCLSKGKDSTPRKGAVSSSMTPKSTQKTQKVSATVNGKDAPSKTVEQSEQGSQQAEAEVAVIRKNGLSTLSSIGQKETAARAAFKSTTSASKKRKSRGAEEEALVAGGALDGCSQKGQVEAANAIQAATGLKGFVATKDSTCLQSPKREGNKATPSKAKMSLLPQGREVTEVDGISVPSEAVGDMLQVREFLDRFSELLKLKKNQALGMLREMASGKPKDGHQKLEAIHMKLLNLIFKDQGLTTIQRPCAWYKAMAEYLSKHPLPPPGWTQPDIIRESLDGDGGDSPASKARTEREFRRQLRTKGVDDVSRACVLLERGSGGYAQLKFPKKLALLRLLCDDLLSCMVFREHVDAVLEELEDIQKAKRTKLVAARKEAKEELARQKLQELQQLLHRTGANGEVLPLTLEQQQDLIKRSAQDANDKAEAAAAIAAAAALAQGKPGSQEETAGNTYDEALLLRDLRMPAWGQDKDGRTFWKLATLAGETHLLVQEGHGLGEGQEERWREFCLEEEPALASYITAAMAEPPQPKRKRQRRKKEELITTTSRSPFPDNNDDNATPPLKDTSPSPGAPSLPATTRSTLGTPGPTSGTGGDLNKARSLSTPQPTDDAEKSAKASRSLGTPQPESLEGPSVSSLGTP